MELDWIGKDSIWSSNLHWNEGWKLIILELMSNNDSMWIRTQINRWAWPDHCWYNVMYLKNSILSCQQQFALRWGLRDSISRFKVNWSLSQSCFVFVLVLILLFVLSVWVFQLLVVHGFERLKRDWTSDRCLAGRPRGEDGPMGRPAPGRRKVHRRCTRGSTHRSSWVQFYCQYLDLQSGLLWIKGNWFSREAKPLYNNMGAWS